MIKMNQEPNNFNQNNFNTQGNNGIPNNQPLNNQYFNQNVDPIQQPSNPQPQQYQKFQQAPNQINMEQPSSQPTNVLESGNSNNQKLTKLPKKINIGLIVGIVVVIAIISIGIIFGSKYFSNENKKNNINSNNNLNSEDNINNNSNESNTNNNSSDEKYDVVLEWASPLLKVNSITSIPSNYDYPEIEDNINNYDVYVAVIKILNINYNGFLESLNITSNLNNVKVFTDTNHLETVTYKNQSFSYQAIYIVVEKGFDIDNTDIKATELFDNTSLNSNTLYVKDNIVTPVTSGNAKLGDCLTFISENIKYYMVLVDISQTFNSESSSDYFVISDRLKFIIIREKENVNVDSHNLFKAFSNDSNIHANSDINNINGENTVVSSELYELQSKDMISFYGSVYLKSYFLSDKFTGINHEKIGLKFINNVEINFGEIYRQKEN